MPRRQHAERRTARLAAAVPRHSPLALNRRTTCELELPINRAA
ncbi:hypothetical protein [Kitasatospora sp. GP82]|nr:hypothetical protein [Kitasatospora sp. GP82]MDH6129240.1 hypothetical protein [Kitasatospora sp. GP82]